MSKKPDLMCKFAVIGDLHYGSKKHESRALSQFCDEVVDAGISDIFVAGDVLDGDKIYRGHCYELCAQGLDDQVQLVIDELPRRKGLTWHLITGNHDASYLGNVGCNALQTLVERAKEQGREDIKYRGDAQTMVNYKGLRLEIGHPKKGTIGLYSSRPLESYLDITRDARPDILLEGHQHRFGCCYRHLTWGFLVGCFQGRTGFMVDRNLWPDVGGLLIAVYAPKTKNEHKRVTWQFLSYKSQW